MTQCFNESKEELKEFIKKVLSGKLLDIEDDLYSKKIKQIVYKKMLPLDNHLDGIITQQALNDIKKLSVYNQYDIVTACLCDKKSIFNLLSKKKLDLKNMFLDSKNRKKSLVII
mgnify:CR=1 FL=1